MKQITLSTTDFTAKDKFNIKAGAKALKDAIGQKLVVTKACIGTDIDVDGREVNAGALITNSGAYTCISKTAVDSISDLIEMLDDGEESITVMVESSTSTGGRDYLVLSIVE